MLLAGKIFALTSFSQQDACERWRAPDACNQTTREETGSCRGRAGASHAKRGNPFVVIIAFGVNDSNVHLGVSDEDGDATATTRRARAQGTKTEGVPAQIRQVCQGGWT